MSLDKDLVSSFVDEVARPSSNPGAAEKEGPSKAVAKIMEAEATQDSNGFNGMCMKKHPSEEMSVFLLIFIIHNHIIAFNAI